LWYQFYFANHSLTSEELSHLVNTYSRSFGVLNPIGTALLFAMSIGAWFALLARSRSTRSSVLASIGINAVLVAIFLTGSRLGVVVAGPALAIGLIWWMSFGRSKEQGKYLLITAAVAIALLPGVSLVNASFDKTVFTVTTRFVSTVPNLLNGTPDHSFEERLAEYSETDLTYFEVDTEKAEGYNSEYVILLKRYGLAGFLLTWQLWLMIIVRSARTANNAVGTGDRSIGLVTMIAAMTLIITGVGISALLQPTLMTILLVVVGVTPVLSSAKSPVRAPVPAPVPIFAAGDFRQEEHLAA
jgi:hypothetical protein